MARRSSDAPNLFDLIDRQEREEEAKRPDHIHKFDIKALKIFPDEPHVTRGVWLCVCGDWRGRA